MASKQRVSNSDRVIKIIIINKYTRYQKCVLIRLRIFFTSGLIDIQAEQEEL
jgi:hypothetical protein